MSVKNNLKQWFSGKNKKKIRVPVAPVSRAETNVSRINSFWAERFPLFTALFLFAFGMGLFSDGKKLYDHQLKLSQRVDYRATLR